MASAGQGKYTLEDLRHILSEDRNIWKWASSHYTKIERIVNKVVSDGRPISELKNAFKQMERTLESKRLKNKLKPSYEEIKKQLTGDSDRTDGARQRSTQEEQMYDSGKTETKKRSSDVNAPALDSVTAENESSPNLGLIRKKADSKKREQGGAVNADPVLEINKKLQGLYKLCTDLEFVCGKAQKDAEQKQTHARKKGSEVKKKPETAVDVNIDKTLADITTSLEHCEKCVTSLLKESKETEDQLTEINRKMHEFNCKAKETLSSRHASSPKEPLNKKPKIGKEKENKKNISLETEESELPIRSTVTMFDECVENVRKMRDQHEVDVTELQKQIGNTQSQMENLNSTSERICNLIEPNADNGNSKRKKKKAAKTNKSPVSMEDETEMLDKINRDLQNMVIPRMEQHNLFYQKCLWLGGYLKVNVEHTAEFDLGLIDKCKEKIDILIKDKAVQDKDYGSELKLLKEELQRSEKRIKDLQFKTEDREEQISWLKKEMEKIGQEKETLLGRLSKIAGTQLTSGNPNITDLSDPNRPLKIGEQYSELYDNEWTDAFAEVHNNASDRECVEAILDVVKKSFEFCRRKADEHLKHIVDAITLTDGTVDAIKFHQIQDLRNIRKIAAETSSSSVYKDFISKPIKHFKGKGGLKFIRKCIDICWFMAVQNPPLWLHWDVKRNDNIDTSLFKLYTNSGSKVDYLVWPALLLRKDGSVIAKGVCQPFKMNK